MESLHDEHVNDCEDFELNFDELRVRRREELLAHCEEIAFDEELRLRGIVEDDLLHAGQARSLHAERVMLHEHFDDLLPNVAIRRRDFNQWQDESEPRNRVRNRFVAAEIQEDLLQRIRESKHDRLIGELRSLRECRTCEDAQRPRVVNRFV